MNIIPIYKYTEFIKADFKKFYPQLIGVDLSVESISRIDSGQRLVGIITRVRTEIFEEHYIKVEARKGNYDLWPGIYSFTFEQGIELDEFHFGKIVPRSSLVRCGGIVGSGIYEPGYKMNNIGAVIHLTNRVIIEKGARVVQMEIYCGGDNSFGKYRGQWSKKDIK